MKNQAFVKKLRNALAGIGFAWTEERNFRVHLALGLVTLLAFAVLQPTAHQRDRLALAWISGGRKTLHNGSPVKLDGGHETIWFDRKDRAVHLT